MESVMEILAVRPTSTELVSSSFGNFRKVTHKRDVAVAEEKKNVKQKSEFNFDLDELRSAINTPSLDALPTMDNDDSFDAWLDS